VLFYLKIVDFFTVDDPRATLTLRVNQQWIPGGLSDNDAVLNGQLVIGQTLQVPLADGGVVNQRRDQRQVNGVRHSTLTQLSLPRVKQLGAEFLVERTSI